MTSLDLSATEFVASTKREREIVLSQDIFYGHVSMSGPLFTNKKSFSQISYIQAILCDTKTIDFLSVSLSLHPSSCSCVKIGSETWFILKAISRVKSSNLWSVQDTKIFKYLKRARHKIFQIFEACKTQNSSNLWGV